MNYLSSFHFYKKINTEMAKTDAINCGFDVGFPSFLDCSKKPGFFVLKILLPFASVQWKTLLHTEIVSCELDLQVKTYCTHSWWVTLGTEAAKDIPFPPACSFPGLEPRKRQEGPVPSIFSVIPVIPAFLPVWQFPAPWATVKKSRRKL